jgi:hypothetical protein
MTGRKSDLFCRCPKAFARNGIVCRVWLGRPGRVGFDENHPPVSSITWPPLPGRLTRRDR